MERSPSGLEQPTIRSRIVVPRTAPDSASKPTGRPAPPAALEPTQTGPRDIRFDFNHGCRLLLPEGDWRVRFTDLDTDGLLFEGKFGKGRAASPHLYFQRYRIDVWEGDEHVLSHDYDAAGREVLVYVHGDALGDAIGWFSYAVKFQEKHTCRLTCAMNERFIGLFQATYPEVVFVAPEAVEPERFYATYHLGVSFREGGQVFQPCDHRLVGTHRSAAYALGVDPSEARPWIAVEDDTRPIEEPYVCIAVQSTLQLKYWNNPDGWGEVVEFLKASGYRVFCIDQRRHVGPDLPTNKMPEGAEDLTGDRPLQDRARWIKHADFFVGLASGLSWLAWALDKPVVMISGFSHPVTEFETPYRVINYHVCNSCWNDVRFTLDHKDWFWCPRQGGTPRQFECSRQITAGAVKAAIRKIPGFRGA
jgi:autotransporter strand-loop-strand O-heptosyltransferase